MLVYSSTQHPSEMQQVVAHMLGWPAHNVVCECRRMGGGFGGKESQSALFACVAALAAQRAAPAGQAARRPRRRLHDHRQAPRRGLRLRSRLRRRRPHPRRARRNRVARAAIRPTCRAPSRPRASATSTTRTTCPTSRSSRCAARPTRIEHRLPRLRRPARRARDGSDARQHRAPARSCDPLDVRRANFYGIGERERHALRAARRGQHHRAAHRRAARDERLSRAPRGDRAFNADEPGAQARHRDHAGEVRHLVHRHVLQPGRRAGARVHRRHRAGEPRRHRDGPGAATPRSRRSSPTSWACRSSACASPRPTPARCRTRRRPRPRAAPT